jgi:peroxiredoxin
MKKICIILAFALIPLFQLPMSRPALAQTEKETIPALLLPVPENPTDREYLGLAAKPGATFTFSDIQADVLLIMLFSMYCPFCQEKAPAINTLFEKLKTFSRPGLKIKMIGLGANNSTLEVEYFRKKYKMQFPLFSDAGKKMYASLGGKVTPDFIGCKRDANQQFTVILRQSGGFVDPDKFFTKLFKKAALTNKEAQ